MLQGGERTVVWPSRCNREVIVRALGTCPVCGGTLKLDRSQDQLERETLLRASFVHNRLGHRPEQLEAMDLTRFMHGGPARLLGCERCGALLRDERQAAQYESDLYDSALMRHLYPRYLRAFEEKRSQYQPLLGN